MEHPSPTHQPIIAATDTSKTSEPETSTQPSTPKVDTTTSPIIHHTKNLYPIVRHTLLIICVLFSLALIILLMHQNGKSIYDNGI